MLILLLTVIMNQSNVYFFGNKNRPHTGRVALYVRNILFLVLVLQKFSQYQTTLVIELHTSSNDSELLICFPDQHLSHSAPLIYTLLTCCNKDARRSGNSLAEFPAHPYLLFQKKTHTLSAINFRELRHGQQPLLHLQPLYSKETIITTKSLFIRGALSFTKKGFWLYSFFKATSIVSFKETLAQKFFSS